MSVLYSILFLSLWNLCQASNVYMVLYRDLSLDFQAMMPLGEYPENDPLNLADIRMRQIVCDKALQVRHYKVLNSATNIPENHAPETLHNYQRINLEEDETLFSFKLVNILGVEAPQWIRTVECVYNKWFLAFGQSTDKIFLLEPIMTDPLVLSMKGLLESIPDFNSNFPGHGAYETEDEYFSSQLRGGRVTSGTLIPVGRRMPRLMNLCFLTFHDHARLCSGVFDVLVHRRIRNFPTLARPVNYVNVGDERCTTKWIMMICLAISKVEVVPCSINARLDSPTFYVIGDLSDRGAAFVLVQQYPQSTTMLKLVGRLTKLHALLDRRAYLNRPRD